MATLAACGDDDSPAADAAVSAPDASAPDAPAPDAAPPPADASPADAMPLNPALCPDTYGGGAVASSLTVAPVEVGFDLDDDDEIDNVLGRVSNFINPQLGASLADGSLIVLAEFRDLDDPTLVVDDDDELTLVLYGGVDVDSPPNVADNFSGEEPFYFATDWVLSDCTPKAAFPASMVDARITAIADEVGFYVETLGGFLQIARANAATTIELDTQGYRSVAAATSLFGGAVKQCALAVGEGPIGESAQDTLRRVEIQPDIDLDGDGLETIVGDSVGILHCVDGDGTIIEGSLCGCDPRMADGYSIAFQIELVGAVVSGPEP